MGQENLRKTKLLAGIECVGHSFDNALKLASIANTGKPLTARQREERPREKEFGVSYQWSFNSNDSKKRGLIFCS